MLLTDGHRAVAVGDTEVEDEEEVLLAIVVEELVTEDGAEEDVAPWLDELLLELVVTLELLLA